MAIGKFGQHAAEGVPLSTAPLHTAGELDEVIVGYTVRCRTCRRVVLRGVRRIADRESDALVSHLKECRPDLVGPSDQQWRPQLGRLLDHFDVSNAP